MAIPIPKDLLIHNVELFHVTTDRWGDESFDLSSPITLNHVRIDNSVQVRETSLGKVRDVKAVLFWDATHSSKADLVEGDQIKWGNETYHISEINYLYDESGLHHKEVQLV